VHAPQNELTQSIAAALAPSCTSKAIKGTYGFTHGGDMGARLCIHKKAVLRLDRALYRHLALIDKSKIVIYGKHVDKSHA